MDYLGLSEELCRMHFRYAAEICKLDEYITSRGEDGVLIWMNFQKNPVYAVDIIQQFDLSAGRVANILKQLDKKDYISRIPEPEDLRRFRIILTDLGREEATQKYGQMVQAHQRILQNLGEEDAVEYIRILKKVFSQAGSLMA